LTETESYVELDFHCPKVPGRTLFPNMSRVGTLPAAPLVLTPFATGLCESALLRRRRPLGELALKTPNQGDDMSDAARGSTPPPPMGTWPQMSPPWCA